MADFNKAITYVLSNEGGYSNRSADRGGPTKYGISWNIGTMYFQRYFNRDITIDDMKNLTIEQAKEIYRRWYWEEIRLDLVNSDAIATAILDVNVNMGQTTCQMLVEHAIDDLGIELPLNGRWSAAITALNAIGSDIFIEHLHKFVVEHYQVIVDHTPSQQAFMQGWLNRADKMLKLTEAA